MSWSGRQFACAVLLGTAVLSGGCRVADRDQLEAGLRRSESRLRDLEHELAATRKQLKEQERELQVLRSSGDESPFVTTGSGRAVETAVAWGAVSRLRIHPLASGVLPAEEDQWTVTAVVQPLDADGETRKVAGELRLQVQIPGREGILAETTLSPLDSRSAWTSGLIARGFQVELPVPDSAVGSLEPGRQILLTATLVLSRERSFQTTALLRIPDRTGASQDRSGI